MIALENRVGHAHSPIAWTALLLVSQMLFVALGAAAAMADGITDPIVPDEIVELQAPWPSGEIRYPQTYDGHVPDCGQWCAVDFYTNEDLSESVGGQPVLAAHSGVLEYMNGGCGGKRLAYVTNDVLGVRTRYNHIRFPAGVNVGDRKPVQAGDVIAYVRAGTPEDPFDSCQHFPHLMFRVFLNLGPLDGWHHVDLRYVALDGQVLFEKLLDAPKHRYHGTPITSFADRYDELISIARTGDSGSLAGTASQIALVSLSGGRVVTAIRTTSGDLKLIAWEVSDNGKVKRLGDSGEQAGAVSEIAAAVTIPGQVITAVRDSAGSLKLIAWQVDGAGAITRLGDSGGSGPTATQISLWANGTLAITAYRAADGRLMVASWAPDADGDWTELADSGDLAGTAGLIAMSVYGIDDSPEGGPTTFRVVTALQTAGGDLKLIVWEVAATGDVTRLGDSGGVAGGVGEIAIDLHDVTYAPDGVSANLVTSVRDDGGALTLIDWDVSADGETVTRLGDSEDQAGAASQIEGASLYGNMGSGLVTAIQTASGSLELMAWGLSSDGLIYRMDDSGSQAGAAAEVSLISYSVNRYVAAIQTAGGNLKLLTWTVES